MTEPGDADPGGQRRTIGFEFTHRLHQLQPRSHRPFGVIFMRLWPAEIGQHTVAHIAGDMTVETVDNTGAGVLIGQHHRAQILRIEPGR